MQIRTRLAFQFLLIGGIIMIISSVSIYYSSANFRKDDFYNRLRKRAMSTASLLLEFNGLDAENVRRIEAKNPVKLHGEKVIILDYKDQILYSTDDNGEIKIDFELLERVRSGRKVAFRKGLTEIMGTLYYVTNDRYVVIAAAKDLEGFLHLEKLGVILFFVFFTSLLLFGIGGWFYAGRALKPISNVIRQVEDISITSLNLRLNEGNGADELARLAQTFNKMLGRLEEAFTMQKDFIAHASHELRTPLTSINGQLDVLMMKERTNEEYSAAISSVLDDIRALIDLSNRLLLIARTRAEGPVRFNKKLRIDETIWQSREETIKFNKNYHIGIVMDDSLTDVSQMVVSGDEYLLKIAVSNLMDNACKYSPDHTVEVKIGQSEDRIKVVFEDKGIGIPEEDLGKIFEPFYRAGNTITYQGSGIGLPLVKQIISNHNGTIEIYSRVGKGTRITVTFPLSIGTKEEN